MNRPARAAILMVLLAVPTSAADGKDKTPVIPAVRERMREFVEQKEIPGAVTLVATPDGIAHLDVVGHADLAAGRALKPDTIFWIASMTKPVTGTAVMMLEEEGKLSLDDPVGKYIPELAALKTPDGKPAGITIRHLLTHTSGMGEIGDAEARSCKTLADTIPLYASKPLKFAPGAKWEYCQSSINTAARIVEVISGMDFPTFLGKRLFDPLGMKDTTFYLTADQAARLTKAYNRTDDGRLEETSNFILLGNRPTSRQRFPAANGGLFSTAQDYARFCRMILRQGELDGKRYLKPETVKKMTSIHSGSLETGFTPGNGWGIGWCVIREPQGLTKMLSPGTHGHGGAYGTQAWIDPVKGAAYILLVQRANFPNSDASEVRRAFQEAAVAAAALP